MPLIDYPATEFSPRHLTKEEIADPNLAIDAFFDYAHLPQHRDALKQLLNAIVTGSFHTLPTEERGEILYYYGRLEKLVEVAHVIHAAKKGA